MGGEFGDGPDALRALAEGRPARPGPPPALPAAGADPLAGARVVVPQGADAIEGIVAVARPALRRGDGRRSVAPARVFSRAGRPLGEVPILPVSSVDQVVRARRARASSSRTRAGWTRSPGTRFDPGTGRVAKTRLAADLAGRPLRGGGRARDGPPRRTARGCRWTSSGMKGTKLDGDRPTILYGYGGYGVNETPRFSRRPGALAPERRRLRQRRPPRRRRVRRGVAPGRQPDPEAERLRRLHRRGRVAREGGLHPPAAARAPGRLERRPARERGGHPAPRPLSARRPAWSASPT